MESASEWSPRQVSDWLRGLDAILHQYIPTFLGQQVDGERLLRLTHQDLLSLGLTQVGHQELMLEAVDLLCALNWGVKSEQLRTVVAKMRAAHRGLNAAVSQRRKNPDYHVKTSHQPSSQFLTAVVDLISAAKSLLAWMDRCSAGSTDDVGDSKSRIIRLCLELTSTVQKDCSVFHMEEKTLEVCQALSGVCDQTLQMTPDPGESEAAILEEVHITNVRPGEGLGIYIKSTYDGLHIITGTTENSPAEHTGRIHGGDEVVQVNSQTVVGWQLCQLVEKLRAESGGVTLLLKKRPVGTFQPAPLRNLRWRPALVQGSSRRLEVCGVSGTRVKQLDSYPPPAPAAHSPPHQDTDVRHRLSEGDRTSVKQLGQNQQVQVRLRPPTSARTKPRPVSMPVESISQVLQPAGRRGTPGHRGQEVLRRHLSNDGISTIVEEEACFPLPYRGHPSVRGVDHIRGSQCFINADLHHSAAVQYPEAVPNKSTPPTVARPQSSSKNKSLLGSWFARLRLLNH